jgi:ribosomal protein L37AE/L43A
MPYRYTPDRASVREPAASTPSLVTPSCPTCGADAVTTERVPSASSYWRCVSCGDVWTPSRRQSTPRWSR